MLGGMTDWRRERKVDELALLSAAGVVSGGVSWSVGVIDLLSLSPSAASA